MSRRVAILSLLSVLALAGCNVIQVTKPIKEGQKVRLDPCSVLTKADAEQIIGAASLPGAVKVFASEGSGSLECIYERADGPRYGELVAINISPEMRASLLIFYPAQSIAIGKEAKYTAGEHEIQVNILNKQGVQYEINAAVAAKDADSLLESVKSLSAKIDERIEKQLESTYKPPAPTSADVDPCTLLTGPEIEPLVGPPGEGGWKEGIQIFRFETFGGRWGGTRSCVMYTTTGTDEEGLINDAIVTLSKSNITAEEMNTLKGDAEAVPRLGAQAFWVSRQLSAASGNEARHDRSWLTVLTKSGRLFDVEVDLHVPGTGGEQHHSEDQYKKVSVELAKKVLAKLP